MDKPLYNWKRYWYLANNHPPFWESGFLHIPGKFDPLFSQGNKDLVTFDEINSDQCLILLGEPGMGKSQAIDDACKSLANLMQPDRVILPFKLAKYSDENRLVQKLFQSNVFQQWLAGSYTLLGVTQLIRYTKD